MVHTCTCIADKCGSCNHPMFTLDNFYRMFKSDSESCLLLIEFFSGCMPSSFAVHLSMVVNYHNLSFFFQSGKMPLLHIVSKLSRNYLTSLKYSIVGVIFWIHWRSQIWITLKCFMKKEDRRDHENVWMYTLSTLRRACMLIVCQCKLAMYNYVRMYAWVSPEIWGSYVAALNVSSVCVVFYHTQGWLCTYIKPVWMNNTRLYFPC